MFLCRRISRRAVGLHPLGAMFALLAGYQVAGVLGATFAVPLAGVVWVVLGAAYRDNSAERPSQASEAEVASTAGASAAPQGPNHAPS